MPRGGCHWLQLSDNEHEVDRREQHPASQRVAGLAGDVQLLTSSMLRLLSGIAAAAALLTPSCCAGAVADASTEAVLTRAITSTGFHHVLEYNVSFSKDVGRAPSCTLTLEQGFPGDVFVDMDFLREVVRMGGPTFSAWDSEGAPLVSMDVEGLSTHSTPFSIRAALTIVLEPPQSMFLELPFHSRYQPAAATPPSHVTVSLPLPSSASLVCGGAPVALSSQCAPVSVSVPVGDTAHAPLVAAATLCLLGGVSFYLLGAKSLKCATQNKY